MMVTFVTVIFLYISWIIISFFFKFISNWVFPIETLNKRIRAKGMQLLRRIPYVEKQIQIKLAFIKKQIGESYAIPPNYEYYLNLPSDGIRPGEINKIVDEYLQLDNLSYVDGMVTGAVYTVDKELDDLYTDVFKRFAWSNPLHPEIFKATRKMELEIVKMAICMFNGPDEAIGTVNTGGTDSILLACKVYRDRAYEKGIENPEMVMPKSAHAAFFKACEYFNITPVMVSLDKNFTCDVAEMARKINKNTCMLVASVPCYPYGTVDPVEEISELAYIHDIGCHVDACLGGFLVPFLKDAGFNSIRYDFSLRGVTSISLDSHKYGFAPKGSSIILYKNRDLFNLQVSCFPDWTGGVYATPNFAGSRVGSNIALCWAAMMYHGVEGYVSSTKQVVETTIYIKNKLKQVDGIIVYGSPSICVVSFTSNKCDILKIFDHMSKKGWSLGLLQDPSGLHMTITKIHAIKNIANTFIHDIKDAIKIHSSSKNLKVSDTTAMYGSTQKISDRSIIKSAGKIFIECYYET